MADTKPKPPKSKGGASPSKTQEQAPIPEVGTGNKAYQVLARKYRPDTFQALIGQEVMVSTLSQAFETGRIAHAFMLTGVRGVGKTTTARLLARALNYAPHDAPASMPQLDLKTDGAHCAAIRAGTHPDVLEIDAASKTGVADMRDLLENARYAPVMTRFRVYIVDEVHMLSAHAFNALLKTLEEPPAHVKFIFATTEIRKVPVTVLSRCQRFDLRRLSVEALSAHLGNIAKLEGSAIDSQSLNLLAVAAEGSVRDGLSLLDQALLQSPDGSKITPDLIREMLGLIDQSDGIEMLAKALSGDAKSALFIFDTLIEKGAVAARVMSQLLDHIAAVTNFQITGHFGQEFVPDALRDISDRHDSAQLSRLWKVALDGYSDLKRAPDPEMAARMLLIRLSQAAKLPSPETLMKTLIENGHAKTPEQAPAESRPHAPSSTVSKTKSVNPTLTQFSDVLNLIDTKANARLVIALKTYIKPVKWAWQSIVCGIGDDAPEGLINRFKKALEDATGRPWTIETTSETNTKTETQRQALEQIKRVQDLEQDPVVQMALKAFPGAQIVEIAPTIH